MPYMGKPPPITTSVLEDADQDTKIQVEESADEDIIRFDIAGAEDFTMAANTFTVLSGSTLAIASGATIANSGTATGFGALAGIDDQTSSNDDQLTITDSAVIINEDGDNLDFRVEAPSETHMFSVDSGETKVGISLVNTGPTLGLLHIETSNSGASVSANSDELVLENAANAGMTIASANDGAGQISFADDGATQQGLIQYSHSTDRFEFYTGGTKHMQIDATGAITKPLQPAFHSRRTANTLNFSGDGTQFTVPFDGTETFDQNADFDGTTFTAPVSGAYLFTYIISVQSIGSSHTTGRVEFKTSNRDYRNNRVNPYAVGAADNWTLQGSIIADMDASDTAYVTIFVGGGAKTVDLTIDATAAYTYFSGCLLV